MKLEAIIPILLLSLVGCSTVPTVSVSKPVYYSQNTSIYSQKDFGNYRYSIGGNITIKGFIPYQGKVEIKENYKFITARW